MTAMSTDTDTIGSAAADAVSVPLDLLPTDAAFGALTTDATGMPPMVERSRTAETRRG
jgi:hypothetical protein